MKILAVFGTRPEAIKFAPLIKAFESSSRFALDVCVTSQHAEMLQQVLTFFNIKPQYDLSIMKANQTLFDITGKVLAGLERVIDESKPDLLFVQGDTTSAFVGALAGFYKRIRVAHLEAGLRTHDRYAPYPEEMNRVMISRLAEYHFAPTKKAVDELLGEGISGNVYLVGNTVIDALHLGLNILETQHVSYADVFPYVDDRRRIVLVTAHRRENFGEGIRNICEALREIAVQRDDVRIVFPVHPNPQISATVKKTLGGYGNIHLIEPLEYSKLIWLMKKAFIIITDSGGIQEEAPALGKPVLVMRDVTERNESIEAGVAILTGTSKEKIVFHANRLLDDDMEYARMAEAVNPYGDGTASRQIVSIIKDVFHL